MLESYWSSFILPMASYTALCGSFSPRTPTFTFLSGYIYNTAFTGCHVGHTAPSKTGTGPNRIQQDPRVLGHFPSRWEFEITTVCVIHYEVSQCHCSVQHGWGAGIIISFHSLFSPNFHCLFPPTVPITCPLSHNRMGMVNNFFFFFCHICFDNSGSKHSFLKGF